MWSHIPLGHCTQALVNLHIKEAHRKHFSHPFLMIIDFNNKNKLKRTDENKAIIIPAFYCILELLDRFHCKLTCNCEMTT